jgi:hypothetical protein
MVDKYDNIIESLVLLNGTACNSYVLGMNETIGGGWLCLNESITIQNNGLDNKTKLGLRLVFRGFGFSSSNI